jgi:hypothetical protein
MDSIAGRMARQWTKPLGTVDIHIDQAKAKRRVSGYTLEKPNCSTTPAQTLVTSSASFLLRSPRALNNQMSPLLPPHHQQPLIATCSQIPSGMALQVTEFCPAHAKKEDFSFFILGIRQPIYNIYQMK